MSKWKNCYETRRKYKERWEKQFAWVEKVNDGSENAFCKLCCKILQPKLWTLICHSKSNDHTTQEEFCHLEGDEPPPCKLKKHKDFSSSPSDFIKDSDVTCNNDAEDFGVYVMESLVSIKSSENKDKLKHLIREAIASTKKLDASEGQPSKPGTTTDETPKIREPSKRKVITMKVYKP